MICSQLHALLEALDETDVHDPALLSRLEARADTTYEPALRSAILGLHGWLTADRGVPPVVGGVSREQLIRWDELSTTWTGPRADGSGPAMVRVLRPHASRDPVLTRHLLREGRVLQGAMPTLVVDDSAPASLSIILAGPAFAVGPRGGSATSNALGRLLAGTTANLVAREDAELGFIEPSPAEIIDAGTHLEWTCLTLADASDPAPVLTVMAESLRRWWDPGEAHTISEVLEALLAAPPRTMDDAAEHVTRTLASVLASRRHALARAARERTRTDRADALEDLVERMLAACPPPTGRGAVGVDLDGAVLVVEGRLGTVAFGIDGGPLATVCDHEGNLDAPLARRLVRTRAGAPISERLNRETQGDVDFVEQITRWTSTALQLRTLRMLLSASRANR